MAKLKSANTEETRKLTIRLEMDGEKIIEHPINLSQHEIEVMKRLIQDADNSFFYALKDAAKPITEVIDKKSKDMAWEQHEKNPE